MNIGFRVFEEITRKAEPLLPLFQGIPVANFGDNMGRLYCVDHHIKRINDLPLLGLAVTVKCAAGDNLMVHRAMDLCRQGDVLVIDGKGYCETALCGEQMFRYAETKGISGIIIDGAIRDLDAVSSLELSVYARGVTPNGPFKNGPGEVNVPISFGGCVVFPGDIVVGDADGIVFIRPQDAAEIAEAASRQNAVEQNNIEKTRAKQRDKSWVMQKLTSQKCLLLSGTYEKTYR